MANRIRYVLMLLVTFQVLSTKVVSGGSVDVLEQAVAEAFDARDYGKAVELMLPRAQSGDAEMQFSVGFTQLTWIDDVKAKEPPKFTIDESISWIRLAAKNRVPQAVIFLRSAYDQGLYTLPKRSDIAACLGEVDSGTRSVDDCLIMDRKTAGP
jgi:hypothetical protein